MCDCHLSIARTRTIPDSSVCWPGFFFRDSAPPTPRAVVLGRQFPVSELRMQPIIVLTLELTVRATDAVRHAVSVRRQVPAERRLDATGRRVVVLVSAHLALYRVHVATYCWAAANIRTNALSEAIYSALHTLQQTQWECTTMVNAQNTADFNSGRSLVLTRTSLHIPEY